MPMLKQESPPSRAFVTFASIKVASHRESQVQRPCLAHFEIQYT